MYVRDDEGELRFHSLGAPTHEEVTEVARWTSSRVSGSRLEAGPARDRAERGEVGGLFATRPGPGPLRLPIRPPKMSDATFTLPPDPRSYVLSARGVATMCAVRKRKRSIP